MEYFHCDDCLEESTYLTELQTEPACLHMESKVIDKKGTEQVLSQK